MKRKEIPGVITVLVVLFLLLGGCGGSGGSGGGGGCDIQVRLADKSWSHPADLSDNISPDGENAPFNPQVAMDNNGNAVIVWMQYDGDGIRQIFKSEYRNGSWSHPATPSDNISPDGEYTGPFPQVAMDDNGNAVIVWSQPDGDGIRQIFKSEYRNGSWSHPADLSDNIIPDGQSADSEEVAMDNNGNAVIVWNQYDGDNWQIFKSEYRNGSWSHPADLSDNISPDGELAAVPQVSMDDNGNAVIVWVQYDGSNDHIFKSEYRNGSWSHPADLSDNISPDGDDAEWYPQVAMDNNGNAVIVWSQSDGDSSFITQIFKSEYRNGSWSHPADLSDNISPDGEYTGLPQVAMDDNGNAVIVWDQSDSIKNQIFKSEYRNGSWSHPADLSDNISPNVENAFNEPQVAMDNNGNAVIVWNQYDGDGIRQIFKSEYRNGSWSHPADLSDNISPDGQNGDFPQVAMDDNGNAVIVWRQSDGIKNQIFMSEFR